MPHRMTRRQALGVLGALALPVDPLLGASPLSPAPPELDLQAQDGPDPGNLYGIVEWIARERAPSLSFLNGRWRSLAAWKRSARPALLRHLGFDPPAPPVRAETVAREERDGFTLETVRIRATPAYDIPARVLVPTGRRRPLPAVVALHCHGGQFAWGAGKLVSAPDDPPALVEYRERLYGRPFAETLARRGFLVVAIDALYFGERRLRAETLPREAVPGEAREAFRLLPTLPVGSAERAAAENRVARAFETVVAKTLFAAGATWPGVLAWDDRRTVDYLASRPDVDVERIGCAGFSGGGLRAALLAASDPRLRAACVVAWMTSLAEMLPGHARRHTWMAFTPGLRASLDLPDAAALLAPGALLVQQCARDTLFPVSGMRGAVERLERIYDRAGIPERFRGAFHDEPHSFTPRMQDEAVAWLERWL
ncbi:MAG TPA: dienelactone hydrolase family protein [Longimicrobiaceae bacterium]|nr:dienelactone hydrolase family protein [Longimicrobiaceae bacterium]